jgi:broad specificity phosphatase PhoE
LSSIYLFRHGQAGLRHHYDTLSETGCEQAYLLGRYLTARNLRFDAVYVGGLSRQQQTAAGVRRAYREAGVELPEPVVDPAWSEFDMTGVFDEVAPLMSAEDAGFRRLYEEVLEQLTDAKSSVHRDWTHCDTLVMQAWMAGRYPTRAEPWSIFHERVKENVARMSARSPRERIAVFTSAMPIAIWVGLSLGINRSKLMQLAGVMYNSAITTMRLVDGELTMFTYNGVPHLQDARLRTFR